MRLWCRMWELTLYFLAYMFQMTLLGMFTLVHDFLHDFFFKVSPGGRDSGAPIGSGCEGSVENADLGGEEVLFVEDCGYGHFAQYLHFVLKGDDRGTSSVGLQESSTCLKKWFRVRGHFAVLVEPF